VSIPTYSTNELLKADMVANCRRCGGVFIKATVTKIDDWYCCDMCIDTDIERESWLDA
jgi:formylmethanofuran dehydrogenase subunit E